MMDLYTRMIVGYAMDSRMTKDLALNALRMARFKRKPKPGLIHHSDRGSLLRFKESLQHASVKLWRITYQALQRVCSTQGLCAVER